MTTRYGLRIVCTRCAKKIDLQRNRQEWLQLAELALALLVLAVLLFSHFF